MHGDSGRLGLQAEGRKAAPVAHVGRKGTMAIQEGALSFIVRRKAASVNTGGLLAGS